MTMRRMALLLGLCWLLGSQPGMAGDYRLWLEVPDAPAGQQTGIEAELGRPLTLLLWYRGPADLDRISTVPWQSDFAVEQGYASLEDDAQRLRLRLTPRRSGQLSLPPLDLGGTQSPALTVLARPAQEHGETLEPHWSVSEPRPWQRQELRAELWLDMAAADTRLTLGHFQPAGFTVRALPASQTTQADGRRRYQFSWLLRPQQAGALTLVAPVLRTVRDGVPRRRFHFPDTALTVRELPPYVPPSVPVGQIHGGDAPGAALSASGIGQAGLSAALARGGFPASVAERQVIGQGTLGQARIDWQRADPGPAGVVFFDPQAGRLRSIHPQPPAIGWQPVAGLLLVALVLGLIWQRRAVTGRLARWRYRLVLRTRLRQDLDADGLAAALLSHPLPGMDSRTPTLGAWAAGYARLYRLGAGRGSALAALLERLARARFGNGDWPTDGAAQLRTLL